jgi:hypothetical protein
LTDFATLAGLRGVFLGVVLVAMEPV